MRPMTTSYTGGFDIDDIDLSDIEFRSGPSNSITGIKRLQCEWH